MKQQTIEWREEKLGVICDVRDGTHASPKYVQEGYPLITSKNLTKGFIDFSDINLISKSDFDEINKRSKVDSGDIIMPMIGTIGNPVIVKKNIREFAIKNVALIKLKNSNISNIYIKFILDSPYFDKVTAKYNRGGTQKFIALGDIRNIPIPLPFSNGKPDLKEQEKIVQILEKSEKIKDRSNNAEKLLNEYLKSVFNEMFYNRGFEEKNIGEIIEYSQYGTSQKSNSEKKGYKVLGMNSISYTGELNFSKHSYAELSKEEFDKLKLEKGDVIFNRTNSPELVGKTTYWNSNESAVLASYLVKLRLSNQVNHIFFSFLLNTKNYKRLFENISKKAINQANISPTLLKTIKIVIPSILLQQKFAKIVEQVEKMKENIKKTKGNSEELFNSLMSKAFKGEL